MDLVGIAKGLADYGPWMIVVILGVAFRWMFTKYDDVQEARLKESKETTIALLGSTEAIKESNRLLILTEARLSALGERVSRRGGSNG